MTRHKNTAPGGTRGGSSGERFNFVTVARQAQASSPGWTYVVPPLTPAEAENFRLAGMAAAKEVQAAMRRAELDERTVMAAEILHEVEQLPPEAFSERSEFPRARVIGYLTARLARLLEGHLAAQVRRRMGAGKGGRR